MLFILFFFFSSRRRHTRCELVTGVQTCALPIYRVFMRKAVIDGAQAPGDHNGLVIAPARAARSLLESTEVTQQIGAAEFIIERRPAYGALYHDVQRTGNAVRRAVRIVLDRKSTRLNSSH